MGMILLATAQQESGMDETEPDDLFKSIITRSNIEYFEASQLEPVLLSCSELVKMYGDRGPL
jgi:hypothetical protein